VSGQPVVVVVGRPNVGKSTIFNALTSGNAAASNYPFTTIEPNVAVAEVPDERLDALVETLDSSKVTPATIYFHDIAGLVKGASEGEGLGNKFLASIRETDAICHVVRAHGDTGVPHPDGSVHPLRDIETIETELVLSDYEQTERRLERVTKQARSGDAEAIAERDWLEKVRDALAEGRPVRSVPAPDGAPDAVRHLQALTSKPMLYVANVDEGVLAPPAELLAHAEASGDEAIALSAKIEAELAELEGDDAAAMREDLGLSESGLDRMIRAAYSLLDLISFFTAGEGTEGRAWSLRSGSTAWDAAGRVHSDIADGFVKAEVIGWRELVDAGGYAAARERGALRIEGRDYVMADGDVITVKHT